MRPKMIVRTNVHAPDIIIDESHPLESSLETLLNEIIDPSSLHFISSEYIMYRLTECTSRLIHGVLSDSNSSHCPLIFDSWSCFNATQAGQNQLESCPEFPDLGFDPNKIATKYCDTDGSWWVHPDTNKLVLTFCSE